MNPAALRSARNARTSKDPKNPGYREQYGVVVICRSEEHQRQIYEQLLTQGHKLKVVTV